MVLIGTAMIARSPSPSDGTPGPPSDGTPGPPPKRRLGPSPFDPSVTLEILNAGVAVNDASNDFAPTLSLDSATLYFCSDRVRDEGMGEMDLWRCAIRLGDTVRAAPANVGPGINSWMNEGLITFAPDRKHAYFTACNRKIGKGECDIFEALLDDRGEVTRARPIAAINSPGWESDPYMTTDGTSLYFISDRPKKRGARRDIDIYVVSRERNGKWGKPRNLGTSVNSPWRDESPCLVGDDLYFASNRPGGFGGFDFYVSHLRNGAFSKPVNLGRLLNSPQDDRFILVLANSPVMFFASERRDLAHYGGLDIFIARPYYTEL